MAKVTPIITRRLETADKMQTAQLTQGVPIELPPALFLLYQRDYGTVGVTEETTEVVADTAKPEANKNHDKLLVIASAISDIMEDGDEAKLTSEGDVRIDVLSKLVGFKVSGDERDAAMELS